MCILCQGYDDDDETGSITSERSSFSLSSEVSIMPYATAKYPNPITVSHYSITVVHTPVCICNFMQSVQSCTVHSNVFELWI